MRRQKYPNGRPGDGDESRVPWSKAFEWADEKPAKASAPRGRKKQESDRSDSPVLAGAEDWLKTPAKPAKRKKSPAAAPKQVEQAVAAFEEVSRWKDWQAMRPAHYLGLYVACHRRVYGVEPADLVANWAGAASAVKSMLAHEFGDDRARFVAFLQWAWAREQARERQRGGEQSFRLGWRLLFVRQAAAGILTDYRTSLARAARTRGAAKAVQ